MKWRYTMLLCVASLTLAACDRKAWTHDEIVDIADDVAADAVADSERISQLEARIEQLESKLGEQQVAISANAALASDVADQVSHNAKVANQNVLKDATARGECGRRTEYGPGQPPAWIRSVPITCTEENYFKKSR